MSKTKLPLLAALCLVAILAGGVRAQQYRLMWVAVPADGDEPGQVYLSGPSQLPAQGMEAVQPLPAPPDPTQMLPPVPAQVPLQAQPWAPQQSKWPVQAMMPVQSKMPVQVGMFPSPVQVGKAGAACCPKPREIIYRDHVKCHCKKGKCCCLPPIQTVLCAADPCCPCGSEVQIPVCLPGTCLEMPTIRAHKGLLGRGIVTYRWCCGAKVEVVFCVNGDIIVHTYS